MGEFYRYMGAFEADDWQTHCDNQDREPLGAEPGPVNTDAIDKPLWWLHLTGKIDDETYWALQVIHHGDDDDDRQETE